MGHQHRVEFHITSLRFCPSVGLAGFYRIFMFPISGPGPNLTLFSSGGCRRRSLLIELGTPLFISLSHLFHPLYCLNADQEECPSFCRGGCAYPEAAPCNGQVRFTLGTNEMGKVLFLEMIECHTVKLQRQDRRNKAT